jgi:hypothetical protein
LIRIDVLMGLFFLADRNDDHFLLLRLIEERTDDFPEPSESGSIVKQGPFCDSAVVSPQLLHLIVEREDRNLSDGEIAEICNESDFLGVIWHHPKGIDDQHKVVI